MSYLTFALPLESQKVNMNKTKKRIPKYVDGMSGILNGINKGAGVVGDAASLITTLGANDDLKMAPTSKAQRGPIQWTKIDELDMNALKKSNVKSGIGTTLGTAASGAKIGSVVPGIGTAIGAVAGAIGGGLKSIFGAKKRRKQLRDANELIRKTNTFNFSDAQSNVLEDDYYDDNADTTEENTFAEGKSPIRINSKHQFTPTALVAKGELIRDASGNTTEVTGGSHPHVDDVPANIKPSDTILSNKNINPMTGNTFAEDGKKLTNMEKRANRNINRNKSIITNNTAKLNKSFIDRSWNNLVSLQGAPTSNARFVDGKSKFGDTWNDMNLSPLTGGNIPQLGVSKLGMPDAPTTKSVGINSGDPKGFDMSGIASIAGDVASLAPTIYNAFKGSEKEPKVTADTFYSGNPYESRIASKLSRMRYNPAQELRQVRDAEARAKYNSRLTNTAGGVGMAIDTASGIASRRAQADAYGKAQQMNNQYSQQAASMMAQLGAQQSAGRSQAMSQAYDINARNKAASSNAIGTALTQLSQFTQNKQLMSNQKVRDEKLSKALEMFAKLGMSKQDIKDLIE